MAVDQALLELGETPILRLYQWNEPTLTLGYFQAAQSRDQHRESTTCPMLRRSTGGGAILHDRELTYSLILPPGSYSQPSTQLYDAVHQAVADRLQNFGLSARRHPHRPTDTTSPATYSPPSDSPPSDTQSGRVPGPREATVKTNPSASARTEPFLCFKRRAAGDLIVWPTAEQADRAAASHKPLVQGAKVQGPAVQVPSLYEPNGHEPTGHKVLGSAQRKRDGAILQHGSVLLERSPHAPQLAGINDFLLSSDRPTADHWIRELVVAISSALGWVPEPSSLTEEELESTERLRRIRFTNTAWNLAR